MRTRRLTITSLALAILIPTGLPAAAKGPGSATVDGPGGTVHVSSGDYRYADKDPFWDLQNESGIIPLALMDGDEMGTRPTGDLGEPLIVIWEMGDRDIVQFFYMNAQGGPVTRVVPDPDHGIRGGWYRPLVFSYRGQTALPRLRTALEELGVEIPAPDPGTIIKRLLIALTAGMVWKI